jgi:MtfA peptidase
LFTVAAPYLILGLIAMMILAAIFYKKPGKPSQFPAAYRKILEEHVAFYRSLDNDHKNLFEQKIMEFLGYVRIHGVGTNVDDVDKVLVASSGVIPIFGFPEWKYYNLRDVLLYPYAFDQHKFLLQDAKNSRNTLGMVGTGAMQRMMILSKPALHNGFDNFTHTENTGIHEFVHLLDKEDGAVDGIPEALLNQQYVIPWLVLMNKTIQEMIEGKSDINIYGATNKAEFFAVASEYFFGRPDLFKTNHKELYELMVKIFNQEPPPPTEINS